MDVTTVHLHPRPLDPNVADARGHARVRRLPARPDPTGCQRADLILDGGAREKRPAPWALVAVVVGLLGMVVVARPAGTKRRGAALYRSAPISSSRSTRHPASATTPPPPLLCLLAPFPSLLTREEKRVCVRVAYARVCRRASPLGSAPAPADRHGWARGDQE